MAEIDRALGRISAAQADGYGIIVRRRDGPGDGWFAAAELDGSGRVEATLMSRITGMSGPPEEHIRAEWMVESLARALADLAGSFAVATGSLPDLTPDNVLLAAEGGLFRATAVTSEELFEGDPQALADRIRAGFTGLMRPTIEWTDSQGLRPAKTLWHAAADRLAQALVWCGKAFDRPDPALELTKLILEPDGPLGIPVERAEDEYGDEFHLRATCCLAYRTPDGYTCQSCPLRKTRGT